jgi:hypothetical protein
MLARWLLVALLLIHPARGLVAADWSEAGRSSVACDPAGCCPLCEIAGECPCAGEDQRLPEPAAPVQASPTSEAPRLASEPEPRVWSGAMVWWRLPVVSAEPAARAVAGCVNQFLSTVCVWTT